MTVMRHEVCSTTTVGGVVSTPHTHKPSWHDGDCDDDFQSAPVKLAKKRKKKKNKKKPTDRARWSGEFADATRPKLSADNSASGTESSAKKQSDNHLPDIAKQDVADSSDDELLVSKREKIRVQMKKAHAHCEEMRLRVKTEAEEQAKKELGALRDRETDLVLLLFACCLEH